MVQYFPRLLGGIVLVVCSVFVPAVSLFGEERSHPSLVDPAITKCTVCHTAVASTHPGIAASQGCLSCHTFIEKSGKTLLIVEANRQPLAVDEPVARSGSANEGLQPEGLEDVAPPKATAAGSQQHPAVEAAAVAAGVAEQPPSSIDSASAGGGAARSGGSIEDGMREFNRGDFDSASDAWSSMLANNPDHFTLQVEVDSYFITVQSTIARYGDHSLYVLKNDDLYIVYSGLFVTLAEANEALKLLPEALRRGGAFPVAVRRIVLHE
jgi:septal ring-binding cell division protein DamX